MATGAKKGSKSHQARELVQRLEKDIGTGVLSPGSWLKQTDLETRFACSRIAIRQALDQLVSAGSVDHIPNRGYQVADYDRTRIANISQVRAALEVATLDDVVARADDGLLERLTVLAEAFHAATVTGTSLDRLDTNLRFHTELMSYCRNPELVKIALSYRNKLPLSVQDNKNTPELMEKSSREHFRILDLLKSRDLIALKMLLHHHIMGVHMPSASVRAPDGPA